MQDNVEASSWQLLSLLRADPDAQVPKQIRPRPDWLPHDCTFQAEDEVKDKRQNVT
jgi:hypothetical protein